MDNLGNQKIYEFENFRLDAGHLMLYHGDEEISVPPKAVQTLLALVERRGEIVSKNELMAVIWSDAVVEESNLGLYLHIVRKTLGSRRDGKPFIETLRRRGYRFNGDVVVIERSNGAPTPELKLPEDNVPHREEKHAGVNKTPRSVERHGNVLALADWREHPRDLLGDSVPIDQAREISQTKRSVSTRLIVGFVSVFIVLAAFWFAWSRFSSTKPPSQSRGDLTVTNLTSGEYVDWAVISPDGNYFVYALHDSDGSQLWLQQPEQASPIQIGKSNDGQIAGATFTKDSKQIYFILAEGPSSALYRLPALGGVRTKLLDDVSDPISFSPDGSKMAFTRRRPDSNQSWLMTASSDGTNEKILRDFGTPDSQVTNGGPAWSPDGKLIAYGVLNVRRQEGGCTVSGTNPDSGETVELSREKWDNCYRMAWTSDGQGLLFVGTRFKEGLSTQRDQIYHLTIATGESRRLTTEGSRHQIGSLSLTDQDEILTVPFNRMSQIWVMDAGGDSRSAVQLTKGYADGRAGIAPLADGRVAYLTRYGDGLSIWIMNADGSDRNQLTTDPPAIEELRSPPSGNLFVFSAKRDGWSHLYRVDANGRNLTQLTFGESFEIDSSVSPDGKWIVYHSEVSDGESSKISMWRIGSEGGKQVQLTEHPCATPHFSPDGRFISCVSRDWATISIISADGGSVIKTFTTSESPVLNVGARWTPDGRSLAYITNNKNIGNIRLQPIDGSAARDLTDFNAGEIYNFAFSFDGSRLFLARGYSTRNAVLIRNFR